MFDTVAGRCSVPRGCRRPLGPGFGALEASLATGPIHAKDNNFGALRLFFACLVIFSHSPSILTGNREFEPHFGPATFGEIAVDGFFLISGFLITKSFVRSVSVVDYFKKRVLRIYPGFVVNILLCTFVLAPLVGAGLSVFQFPNVVQTLLRLLLLSLAKLPGVFPGMPMPSVNGSAWTIPYEFRCYILVAALGLTGAYARLRVGILIAALACLIVSAPNFLPDGSGALYVVFGGPFQTVHLTGIFMVGMLFYLYQDRVVYNGRIALAAAALLIASAFVPAVTEFALATCGGYLIFLVRAAFSRFANQHFRQRNRPILRHLPLRLADSDNDRLSEPINNGVDALVPRPRDIRSLCVFQLDPDRETCAWSGAPRASGARIGGAPSRTGSARPKIERSRSSLTGRSKRSASGAPG